MKPKIINMTISRKINSWLESIEDEKVRNLARENTIVTGGCIVSMLLGEQVNDFDLYFRNKETTEEIAKYYVEKFKKNPPSRFKDSKEPIDITVRSDDDRVKIVVKSQGIAGESGIDNYGYFEQLGAADSIDFVDNILKDVKESTDNTRSKFRPVFLSANAITLSQRIQLVIRFFGEPEQIHSTYDFVHCTSYWDSKTRELTLSKRALESIISQDLFYMGQSKYPICAMIRIRKFLSRGWKVTAGQILKIAWDISKLDLSNPTVLEDQLTGVGAAYFNQVITLLRKKDPDKIDGSYLMEVIDQIF